MTPYKLKAKPYKLLVIVGPTSSGKSELAVKLAQRFNGEIISADSRQIYKGMDLGTGKVTGKWKPPSSHPKQVPPKAGRVEGSLKSMPFGLPHSGHSDYVYIYKSIPHHLIDIANPVRQFSVARFQREAKKIILQIVKRGKLPIICGGTMHWIDSVVYNQQLPNVKPNPKLRKVLEQETTVRLFMRIREVDPERAKTIDPHNRRRLIRALEIILTTGKPVPPLQNKDKDLGLKDVFWLGINPDQETLYKKIEKRLKQRLKDGMIQEVRQLHSPNLNVVRRFIGPKRVHTLSNPTRGLSYKRLESFGLEYKYLAQFLQNKISKEEMFTQLLFAIKHYSKRQMTWWKRNKEIHWISNPAKPPLAELKTWVKK